VVKADGRQETFRKGLAIKKGGERQGPQLKTSRLVLKRRVRLKKISPGNTKREIKEGVTEGPCALDGGPRKNAWGKGERRKRFASQGHAGAGKNRKKVTKVGGQTAPS